MRKREVRVERKMLTKLSPEELVGVVKGETGGEIAQ